MRWELALLEGDAGKLEGQGVLERGSRRSEFAVTGLRARSKIGFDLRLDGRDARLEGSVLSPTTIVGRVYLGADTVLLTFEKR